MSGRRARILLIGAGRFGLEHLAEWTRLANDGVVDLAGVVATSETARAAVHRHSDIAIHDELTDEVLRSVDGVNIVTPADSHAALVRRCLPLAHVLVEKPLATEAAAAAELTALARAHGRVLMVGHVFRFHPVIVELKRLVTAIPERPRGIHGSMINPGDARVGPAETNFELLHLFDIVDYLFEVEPDIVIGRRRHHQNRVSLRYPGPMNAVVQLGWEGQRRSRRLELIYSDRRIVADLIDHAIVVSTRNNQLHKSFFPARPDALLEELRTFVSAIHSPASAYPDGVVGERIVRVALASRPHRTEKRPRVAVVGGGIFGATCALELSRIADVTLFERHAELLTETSFTNQRRHHSGFHYPRSYDTIVEIGAARQAFEDEYGDAIDRRFRAYYCASATGVEIPAERYLAACQSNHLSFAIVDPPAGVIDASAVSLCLETDEAVYDMGRLRQLVTERLTRNRRVRCRLHTTVEAGVITSDGAKRLRVSGPDGTREESFDYLVNATYASRNLVARWFGFPIEPLRFDLYELLLLRLPAAQICLTVLDGPFTSLIGTGRENLFLLSHIHDSVSRSVIPDDGMPPQWSDLVSNRANMLRHSERYFPILSQASDVQSWWVTRAVNAFARDFDARPTVITDHGFGCWSVLGGKIVTSVVNARDIAREILAEQGAAFDYLPGGVSVQSHRR